MANLKTLSVNDTTNLTLPKGTAANRPTTTPTVQSFTSVGTTSWTCPAGVTTVEVLVVAGGGGGGGSNSGAADRIGGGGGAGGLIYNSAYPVKPGVSYTVTVGGGGSGGAVSGGTTGSNSVFGPLTALGGGGAGGDSARTGKNGGSGGGGCGGNSGGLGTQGQGFDGGTGFNNAQGAAGGGGGAGGPGGNGGGAASAPGGNGGPGLPYAITGTLTYYAGGGGGASNSGTQGQGGAGGGGNGATSTGGTASANTGGGGGGGGSTTGASGGAGGSGIVVVRYVQDANSTDANSKLRYNTDTNTIEGFQANQWTSFSATENSVINKGLVLHIDPANYIPGASTVKDRSATGATGTLNNGVGYSTNNGGYFTFDGSNDYIRIPMSSALDTLQKGFTLSYWCYPTGTGDYHFFTNHIQGATSVGARSGLILALGSGGTLIFQTRLNNTCCQTVSGVGAYVPNKWMHITGSYDGQYLRLYKNGQHVSGLAATGPLNMINDIFLGINSDTFRFDGTYGQAAAGRLGPLTLYNRCLTEDEIKTNYRTHLSRFADTPDAPVEYTATYVKEGLVLNLDPAMKSFDYGPTVAYDGGSASRLAMNGETLFRPEDKTFGLDGSSDWLGGSSSQFALGTQTTWELWGYISSYSGKTRQYLIDLRGDGGDNPPFAYFLLDHSGSEVISITVSHTGTELQATGISAPSGRWHQFVAVRDGATQRIFFNGAMVACSAQNQIGLTTTTMNQAFRIGSYSGASGGSEYWFQGRIGGARVYDRALTHSEIAQNYQAMKFRFGLM